MGGPVFALSDSMAVTHSRNELCGAIASVAGLRTVGPAKPVSIKKGHW